MAAANLNSDLLALGAQLAQQAYMKSVTEEDLKPLAQRLTTMLADQKLVPFKRDLESVNTSLNNIRLTLETNGKADVSWEAHVVHMKTYQIALRVLSLEGKNPTDTDNDAKHLDKLRELVKQLDVDGLKKYLVGKQLNLDAVQGSEGLISEAIAATAKYPNETVVLNLLRTLLEAGASTRGHRFCTGTTDNDTPALYSILKDGAHLHKKAIVQLFLQWGVDLEQRFPKHDDSETLSMEIVRLTQSQLPDDLFLQLIDAGLDANARYEYATVFSRAVSHAKKTGDKMRVLYLIAAGAELDYDDGSVDTYLGRNDPNKKDIALFERASQLTKQLVPLLQYQAADLKNKFITVGVPALPNPILGIIASYGPPSRSDACIEIAEQALKKEDYPKKAVKGNSSCIVQ